MASTIVFKIIKDRIDHQNNHTMEVMERYDWYLNMIGWTFGGCTEFET